MFGLRGLLLVCFVAVRSFFSCCKNLGTLSRLSALDVCAPTAPGGVAAEELGLGSLFLPRRLLSRFSLWVPQPCCGAATAFLCGLCPLPVRLCPTPSRELAPCTRSLGALGGSGRPLGYLGGGLCAALGVYVRPLGLCWALARLRSYCVAQGLLRAHLGHKKTPLSLDGGVLFDCFLSLLLA